MKTVIAALVVTLGLLSTAIPASARPLQGSYQDGPQWVYDTFYRFQ